MYKGIKPDWCFCPKQYPSMEELLVPVSRLLSQRGQVVEPERRFYLMVQVEQMRCTDGKESSVHSSAGLAVALASSSGLSDMLGAWTNSDRSSTHIRGSGGTVHECHCPLSHIQQSIGILHEVKTPAGTSHEFQLPTQCKGKSVHISTHLLLEHGALDSWSPGRGAAGLGCSRLDPGEASCRRLPVAVATLPPRSSAGRHCRSGGSSC